MKRVCCLIVLLFSVTSALFSLTLDLRTHLLEKHKLLSIKAGASYYLLSDDYTLLEVDEDYAIWLEDYKKEKRGDRYHVSFYITVTEPTMIEKKQALARKKLSFSYDTSNTETMAVDESFLTYLKEKFTFLSDTVKAEATIGGRLAYKAIDRLVKKLESK